MSELKTFPIRLSTRADSLLRGGYRYRGDLSAQLTTILGTVNLDKIEIHRFPTGRPSKDDDESLRHAVKTSIRLEVSLYEHVRKAAAQRDVSINELFNSAILAAHATL